MRHALPAALVFVSVAALPPSAVSQGIPVIDVAAVTNLIQQLNQWQRQLTAMGQQLSQLQQTHQALTGGRGMQALLATTYQQRNYLPQDYVELMNTVNGTSQAYAGLTAQLQQAITANAVLSNTQLAALTPEMRQLIENGRKSAALVSTLSRTAYQNTSQRFGALQQLVTAIGNTGDLKAIQELQGRINAEQAMLTNEQTKLQMLFRVSEAEEAALRQRAREQVLVGHGGFSSRFTPR
jgi:type IV secretion system protein VirB5